LGPFETVGNIFHRILWAHSKLSRGSTTESYGPIRNCRKKVPANPSNSFEWAEYVPWQMLPMGLDGPKTFTTESCGPIQTHREHLPGNGLGPFDIIGKTCHEIRGPMQNDRRDFFMGLFKMIERIFRWAHLGSSEFTGQFARGLYRLLRTIYATWARCPT
jgi:hypothetical protein